MQLIVGQQLQQNLTELCQRIAHAKFETAKYLYFVQKYSKSIYNTQKDYER